MVRIDPSRRVPMIAWAATICLLLAPTAAAATTTLQIVQGSGEFRTLKTDITVSDPAAITFQWTTSEANAASGHWKVKRLNGGTSTEVAHGDSTPAPKPGHFVTFTIPATGAGSFLAAAPPANAVKYTVSIDARDASNGKLGSSSPDVTVTQEKAKPQQPVHFSGRNPVFPKIQLVHYDESIGTVGETQIWSVTATVTLRGENFGKTKTDSVGVAINDWNNLWKMTGNSPRIDPLEPGKASKNVTIKLTAQLPPPKSQLGQEQQVRDWQQEYKDRCGVDLRAYLTASSKEQLIDTEQEQYLYLGYGNSKPWEEGHAVSTANVCDAKQCVNLNNVARSIYKQLACRVVGYAFYVGNSLKVPYAIFDSYGLARTRDNPPALAFGPGTKMQIASTSKILTALTAIKVIGDENLGSFAYKKFPSDWHVKSSLVKNITDREFISQTSGVKTYNTGPTEDDSDLKALYTQELDANAVAKCGSTKHPITKDKSWCYSNANFSIMRVVIPRADGETSNDATVLGDKYVSLARQKVFDPVGATDVACAPPSSLDHYALAYKYPGINGGDWGPLTTVCGAWGWYVSVEDYARVLLSLNSADHKILNDCQFLDMQTNPAPSAANPSWHGIGWDTEWDGTTRRLEKNGGDSMGNGASVGTSVTIYGGSVGTRSGGTCTPGKPGVVGVLFINSDGADAAGTLLQALHDGSKPKP